MKTEIKSADDNEVVLAIEVPHDDVSARVERTTSRLARQASLPGFRPGKAPRAMIVQRLGEEYVLVQTLEDSLGDWVLEALIAAEVDPVSTPEVDYDEFTGKGPFSFTARFQVRPEVVLGEYKGVAVPRPAAEVTDAQVDAQLAMLQERFATLKPVEGRSLAVDDFAELDFEGSVDGEPLEGAQAEGYMLQVGSGNLIPGFEEAIVGMAAGDEKEFELTFSDDYRAEELRGKQATFKVAVKEIKEKVVPALDDELAGQASEFDTLAELREFMRERLAEGIQAGVEREFRGRVVAAVVDNATVNIPSAMTERQAHILYHELEATLAEQGMETTRYLEIVEKTAEEVERELHPRAETIVRQSLIISAIRDAEQIEVSDDEVRAYLTEEAQVLERDPTQHILEAAKAGRQDEIRAELVMAKTVDFLVANAIAVDEPAHDSASGDADGSESADAGGSESADAGGSESD